MYFITTFFTAGPPFSARNPSHSVQQYHQNDVTLSVQWQPPVYDGGAPVDNYTITVTPGGSTFITPGTSILYTLSYNVIQTVSIVATNCNGSSSALMETFRIGKANHCVTIWCCIRDLLFVEKLLIVCTVQGVVGVSEHMHHG